MYTKPQLEGLRKDLLVETALELQQQLEAASGKALTPGAVQKRLLDLTEKALVVKADSDREKNLFELKLAEIESEKELSIEKLTLEYKSNLGKSPEELIKAFSDLEDKAEKAIKDLTYGLEVAEIESEEKLAVILEKEKEAKLKYEEFIAANAEKLAKSTAETQSKIQAVKDSHDRDLEQLVYDNKIAIRDEKLPVAKKIAELYSQELIDSSSLKDLKEFKKMNEEEVAKLVATSVEDAVSAIKSSSEAKIKAIESATANKIALLENDNRHYQLSIVEKDARIKDVEDRLKLVPAQISAAVEAAKTSTVVNQTAGK